MNRAFASPVVSWRRHAGAVAGGVLIGVAAAAPLVWQLRTRLAAAQYRARHDSLTGLLNRAGLREQFAGWQRRPLLLVLVDLDGFKAVNDRFGHPLGDALLTGFAGRLAASATQLAGVAGRLGGDEFLLLLDGGDADLAQVSDRIRAMLSPTSVPNTTADRALSASAGAAVITGYVDWSEGLRRADIALYQAKCRRSRLTVYRPGMAHPRSAPGRAVDQAPQHAD
jgi:diguanylate cyclase (GGDEF)-like protein